MSEKIAEYYNPDVRVGMKVTSRFLDDEGALTRPNKYIVTHIEKGRVMLAGERTRSVTLDLESFMRNGILGEEIFTVERDVARSGVCMDEILRENAHAWLEGRS